MSTLYDYSYVKHLIKNTYEDFYFTIDVENEDVLGFLTEN